jgi:hypothetical protein
LAYAVLRETTSDPAKKGASLRSAGLASEAHNDEGIGKKKRKKVEVEVET